MTAGRFFAKKQPTSANNVHLLFNRNCGSGARDDSQEDFFVNKHRLAANSLHLFNSQPRGLVAQHGNRKIFVHKQFWRGVLAGE
jgi:hypothetical protein